MKQSSLLFLLLLFMLCPSVTIRAQLNHLHNHLRIGDQLIKQQVEYKDPGLGGIGLCWDYSDIQTISSEYTVSYLPAPMEGDSIYVIGSKRYSVRNNDDSLFLIGYEHNTRYYYLQSQTGLFLLGHENPAVRLEYSPFLIQMPFPFNYGDKAEESEYVSDGLYSSTQKIHTSGNSISEVDAYGSIVLPDGDSISPVLRVKTIQLIKDENKQENNSTVNTTKQLETYRWYAKGYRYALLEMVRSIDIKDNTQVFATGFFYPPQEHLYLETDPENQKLLDELWDIDKENNDSNETDENIECVSLQDILECKVYPNPVTSILNLEYEVKKDAKVSFDLYSIEGMPIRKIKSQHRKQGVYNESIDCANLNPKNYILRITANDLFVNHIIIKK